ncbi:hypothetical protein F5Y17DRAFT_139935 [Xylariaceae sp. FL0594]|nr:hypothetical protein F5Y17DRAFT_139935 [Xylariaceae sp. FL0594]
MTPSDSTRPDAKLGHLERTATEPRDKSLHTVVLQSIDEVNEQTRVFRLGIPRDSPPIRFLPGQWLDVYVPGVSKAGGFTITSTPQEARLPHPEPADAAGGDSGATSAKDEEDRNVGSSRGVQKQGPYLELAVQKSPGNPAAAWLWCNDDSTILGKELRVRVGGSFVWPPPGINVRSLRRVVFVAGGVGVNPLVSMLSTIASSPPPSSSSATTTTQPEIHFFYSLRDPLATATAAPDTEESSKKTKRRLSKDMLFLDRIAGLFRDGRLRGRLHVFLTNNNAGSSPPSSLPNQKPKNDDGVIIENEALREQDQEQEEEEEEAKEDHENVIISKQQAQGEQDKKEETETEIEIPFHPRRCTVRDDIAPVLPADKRLAVVYVCGVPAMTDAFVSELTRPVAQAGLVGMEPHRVLCEKWW